MKEIIQFVSFLVVVVAIMISVGITLDAASCQAKADLMGRAYRYSLKTGCMVKSGSNWMPIDQVIETQ